MWKKLNFFLDNLLLRPNANHLENLIKTWFLFTWKSLLHPTKKCVGRTSKLRVFCLIILLHTRKHVCFTKEASMGTFLWQLFHSENCSKWSCMRYFRVNFTWCNLETPIFMIFLPCVLYKFAIFMNLWIWCQNVVTYVKVFTVSSHTNYRE